MKRLLYKDAGVDIEKEKSFVKTLLLQIKYSRSSFKGFPIHYTSLIDFGDYYLAMNTDGVGSKVIVAEKMNMWEGIAIDCVAMNVNDTICVGAEPIAFVDYIALREENEKIAEELGRGFNKAAELANISIVGGETATLPDLINGVDVSGTSLGVVRKNEVITGDKIENGDIIIMIPSSGIHSNGLSLARKVLEKNNIEYHAYFPEIGKRIGEELLIPTRIYVREILSLIEIAREYGNPSDYVHGIAHISGGGITNLLRLKKKRYHIEKTLPVPKIFKIIQELGNIPPAEMYRTFNMGVGMIVIVSEEISKEAKNVLKGEIGGIVEEGKEIYIEGEDLIFSDVLKAL